MTAQDAQRLLDKAEAEALLRDAEKALRAAFERIDQIALHNQEKVLNAFWAERVAQSDLVGSTGYGLDDAGRGKLERVYARVFGAEAALVRPQIVSGTHAIRLGLFGCLRPGNEVVFATGVPYDTLQGVIGIRETAGSLMEWGVSHRIVPLQADGRVNLEAVDGAITGATTMVFFQKSRGYADRPALTTDAIGDAIQHLREQHPHVVFAVDNCYGEFVEMAEPTERGADLVMGSLIKNPGAGWMTTGGYVIGKDVLVNQAAAQLTAPGVGGEYGPTHDFLRPLFQSLFLAPHTVGQAVKGSLLAAHVFHQVGYRVSPTADRLRSDLILSIEFGDPDKLLRFCQAVQQTAPVDSFVRPDAGDMAGYDDPVVMAAGTFVQGGSLEMSADAPMRPPYIGYLQGGLTYEHIRIAVKRILTG